MKNQCRAAALSMAILAGGVFASAIENDALRVEFRESDATFDVADKASGRVWRMMNGEGPLRRRRTRRAFWTSSAADWANAGIRRIP